jgi:hypothetical protein
LIQIIEIGDYLLEGTFYRHSTFKNISNFINSDKKLISISHKKKYLSPNSIIISENIHQKINEIINKKYEIIINNERINKKNIKKYNSEIKIKKIDNFQHIYEEITDKIFLRLNKLKDESLVFLIDNESEHKFKSKFHTAYIEYIKFAWNEIKNGNLTEGIKKIKGSGKGLTPAGDDFICGMLYAINVIGQLKKVDTLKLRNEIYKAAESNNDISRTMIYHASVGAYFNKFKNFQFALFNDQKKIDKYIDTLIKTGETSGSDMLTGYYLCLKYLNKLI